MNQSGTKPDQTVFSPSEIHGQMERILKSPEFNATDAQCAFLQYVIAKKLAGLESKIKGYAIATEVFGRDMDFDQSADPIVSMQANKLRRALERYYLVAGQSDPVRIDIPKGTYVPKFEYLKNVTVKTALEESQPDGTRIDANWPSLVVQPLANLTGNPEFDLAGTVIAAEIAMEITRYQEIHVFQQPPDRRKRRASDCGARFALNGHLDSDASHLGMSVFLTDLSTGRQVWADAHRTDLNPAHLMSFGKDVARIVAGKISAENGVIARQLTLESRHTPPHLLSTYEAILRYHEFAAQFSRRSFLNAMQALRLASRQEPDCGLVWSMLSRLYAINYATELFDPDTPIEAALKFAWTAVKLDPANQRIRITLAYALMIADEIPAARAEANRALDLNPHSLIFLDNIGYVIALLGDWQRGTALVRQAINANPHHNPIVRHVLWLDMFRQRNYHQAWLETLHFSSPGLFWQPLAKAATLGHLGRIQEGRQAADDLLKLKPVFVQRGKRLIRHYVKFDEIIDQLSDGLDRLGLKIEDSPQLIPKRNEFRSM